MVKQENHILFNGTKIRLNASQWKFAKIFALTDNATQSRLKAGYTDHSNKNKKRNAIEAYKLLQSEVVQQAYEHHKYLFSQKLDISVNRVIAEIAAIGFSNKADTQEKGKWLELHEMKEQTQRAIKRIHTDKDGEVIDIEMYPKMPALATIMEIKGMTEKNTNQPILVTVNIQGQADIKKLGKPNE